MNVNRYKSVDTLPKDTQCIAHWIEQYEAIPKEKRDRRPVWCLSTDGFTIIEPEHVGVLMPTGVRIVYDNLVANAGDLSLVGLLILSAVGDYYKGSEHDADNCISADALDAIAQWQTSVYSNMDKAAKHLVWCITADSQSDALCAIGEALWFMQQA